MKKKIIYLIFLVFSVSSVAMAQRVKPSSQKMRSGYVRFYFELNSILKYPSASEKKNTIGMSVSKVVLAADGKPKSVDIINPLDRDIDDAVTDALKKLQLDWLLSDSSVLNRTFYFQIAFILEDGPSEFFFKSAVPDKKMFVKPVAIYGFPEKEGQHVGPKNDSELTEECNIQYNGGNYKKALKIVDEMIRRYPYTKALYQLRILIAKKLNNTEIVERDILKMSNFAEGMSIDTLLLQN